MRFGGGKKKRLTTAERWKLKKQGKAIDDGGNDMETFMKVTEIANKIVDTGNIDVYEETYEMINIKMQRYKASRQPKPSTDPSFDMFSEESSSTVGTKGSTVDIKGSTVDTKGSTVNTKESTVDTKGSTVDTKGSTVDTKGSTVDNKASTVDSKATNVKESSSPAGTDEKLNEEKMPVSDVRWEYRWEEKDDAEIHGPFSSEQMVTWKDSDFFKSGVFVRKVTERTGPWYNSSRIDFDLYT